MDFFAWIAAAGGIWPQGKSQGLIDGGGLSTMIIRDSLAAGTGMGRRGNIRND
jgi:hypothetical protein